MVVKVKKLGGVRFTIAGRDQVHPTGSVINVRDDKYTKLMLYKGYVEKTTIAIQKQARKQRTITVKKVVDEVPTEEVEVKEAEVKEDKI